MHVEGGCITLQLREFLYRKWTTQCITFSVLNDLMCVDLLDLAVGWVQDVVRLLSALPWWRWEDYSSSGDKHTPAAASAAGGPYMQ